MLNKHISLSIEQREAVDNEEYILASIAIGQRLIMSCQFSRLFSLYGDKTARHHSERLDKQRNEKQYPPDLQLGPSGSETNTI